MFFIKRRKIEKKFRILIILLIIGNLTIPSLLLIHMVQNKSWFFSLTNDMEEAQSSIAISDDGNFIVVGSANDNLYLFNKLSAIPVWTYKMEYDISSVDISSNGKYIVVGVRNHKLYLFERTFPIPIWVANLEDELYSVSISADGNNIVAGHYVFHRSSPEPIWVNTQGVRQVELSKDGKYIETLDPVGIINCYNINSSEPIWSYAQGDYTLKIATCFNGSYVCAGGQDRYFYFFNNSIEYPKTPMWNYRANRYIRSVAMSSDGLYCIAGTTTGVHLFSRNNSNPIMSNSMLGEVLSVDISADGQYFCVGTVYNAYLFNRENSTPIFTYKPDKRAPYTIEVKISSSGNTIIASSGYKFYFIDRFIPEIKEDNELKLNAIQISIWVLITLDILPILIISVKASIKYIKKLPYRKLEKRKREVDKTITGLDKEFERWEKEGSKQEP